MRILFISGTLCNGGAERVLSIIANKMSDQNEVTILTIYNDRVDYPISDKINIFHLSSTKLFRQIRIVLKIRKKLKLIKPDFIISFLTNVNIYSIMSNFLLSSRLIISERNDPYNDPKSVISKIARRLLYNHSDALVCQTKMALKYFKWYKRFKTIITNPVSDVRTNRSRDSLNNVIYTAARLSSQKNIPLLISTFDEFCNFYDNFELHIYGEGEEKNNIINMIKKLKSRDKIHLKGFSSNILTDIANNFMFVLPSNYEGLPNSLLEAMTIGIPSISTDCPIGGPREIIDDNVNGILVPVNDANKMLHAMIRLVRDEQLYEKISNESLKIKISNSIDHIVSMWYSLMSQI